MRKLARSTWILAALAAACASPQDPDGATGDFQSLPADQIMTGVIFRPTSNGIPTALLHADTVYTYNDSSRYDLVDVDLEMYDATGALTGTLTSKTGEYNTRTQAMVGRGDVVLITQDSVQGERRIETEELYYDPSTRQIWSDVPTVMYTRNGPIRGSSFRTDDGFNNVSVTQYRGALPGNLRRENR